MIVCWTPPERRPNDHLTRPGVSATPATGCLHIAPGSHTLGYLPHELEDHPDQHDRQQHGRQRGRAGQAVLADPGPCQNAAPVPIAAGNAIVFDVALLHRSGTNTGDRVRIGLNIRYVAPGAARTRDGSAPVLDPISGTAW